MKARFKTTLTTAPRTVEMGRYRCKFFAIMAFAITTPKKIGTSDQTNTTSKAAEE